MRLAVLALLPLPLTLTACHTSPTVFTRGCLAIVDRATCTFTATAAAPLSTRGTIDAAYASQYTCTALVEGLDLSSAVTLDSAQIEVLDPAQSGAAIERVTVPVTAVLEPSTPLGAVDVPLVDADLLQRMTTKEIATGRVQEVVSQLVLVGHDANGNPISTSPLGFPVEIRVASSCVATAGPRCTGGSIPAAADCRLGIDEPTGTSCQTIAARLGACHALECYVDTATGKSDLTTARCPTHAPPDDSCCHP